VLNFKLDKKGKKGHESIERENPKHTGHGQPRCVKDKKQKKDLRATTQRREYKKSAVFLGWGRQHELE